MDNQKPIKIEPTEQGNDGEAWDQARIESALERLNELHAQSRNLRDTIPKMIGPLLQKQPSPDIMFQEFLKAINQAQADVKGFTEKMRNEETRTILAHTEQSAQQDPFNIQPWRHKENPDWFSGNSKS